MVGIGTAALMGVPGLGRYAAPAGGIVGRVRDPDGRPLAHAELALFEHEAGLVEIVHSDRRGRFAFGRVPARYHVFASVPDDAELLGSWITDRDRRVRQEMEVTLARGTRATVRVTDPDGLPVEDAEVRVLDLGQDGAAIQRTLTDQRGEATVVLPHRSRLAVLHSTRPGLQWFDPAHVARQTEGADALELRLGRTSRLDGIVHDAARVGVAGAVVTAWDEETDRWWGWARADEAGRFHLHLPESAVHLRAADPSGTLAPAATRIGFGPGLPEVALTLTGAPPMEVRVEQDRFLNRVRVRSWSEEGEAWSWGQAPGTTGIALVPAAASDFVSALDHTGRPVPVGPPTSPPERGWEDRAADG
jgi:hypothetical protein